VVIVAVTVWPTAENAKLNIRKTPMNIRWDRCKNEAADDAILWAGEKQLIDPGENFLLRMDESFCVGSSGTR
jgi:hypothetical protein